MVALNEIVINLDAVQNRITHRRQLHLSVEAVRPAMGAAERVVMLDLSETGFLMRGPVEVEVGEPLEIVLPDDSLAEASVAWTRDDLYGCRFRSPLSRAAVSSLLLRSPALGPFPAPAEDPSSLPAYSLRRKVAVWIGLGTLCWVPVLGAVSLVI